MVSLVGLASAGIDRLTGVPSQWGGLSRALMARFYPVESVVNEATGHRTFQEARDLLGFGENGAFTAPITDVNFELTGNWQSPFENSGPENKAPSLMAIIQSGQLGTSIAALQGVAGAIGLNADGAKEVLKKSQDVARQLEGKTGMTKLNSTQVFSGSPPIKITMTLHFRALQNPTTEVEKPYNALVGWAAPKRLADDSYLNNAANSASGDKDFLDIMFPSEAPSLIGFNYTGNNYLPMVIESISNPLDGQLGISGQSLYKTVQVQLSTLTALDSEDLKKIFKRQGFF